MFRCLVVVFVPLLLMVPVVAQQLTEADVAKALQVDLPEDPATVIAHVDTSPILLGDIMPKVEAIIRNAEKKSPQPLPPEQIKFVKVTMLRNFLTQAIIERMKHKAFLLGQVGTESPDRIKEADAEMMSRARELFKDTELPALKEQYKVDSLTELNEKMTEHGISLAAHQHDFIDKILGHLHVREQIDRDPPVTIAEINNYYQTHLDEFKTPHRARWEQLSALFAKNDNREDARQLIWEMGREAYFGGNLQAVAKAKSQEPFASSGGLHEWTQKGSLASQTLDEQIFSIPTNAMSEIIEDSLGFHIVRVLDREPAGTMKLSEVQDKIRQIIKEQKIAKAQKELLDKIYARVPVWTIFPETIPGAKPMPTAITQGSSITTDR